MSNKYLPCVLVIMSILALLCAPTFAAKNGELTVDEVTAIARQYMVDSSGLTEDEMLDFHCQLQELGDLWNGTRYWTIVFVSDITGSEFWVQVDYRSGFVHPVERSGYAEEYRHFLEMAEMKSITDNAKAVWEQEKGPYVFWSYEEKAVFYEEYPGAEKRHLPDPNDMNEAAAVQVAKDEMRRMLLADDDYIESFRLDIGFSKEFLMNGIGTPTWLIGFRVPVPEADGVFSIRHLAVVNANSGETTLIMCQNENGTGIFANEYQDEMYYNPDGGLYFHHDADCWTVDDLYKPLLPYSRGDIIYNDTLSALMPCQRCVYHDEGDWGSDWTRG